MLKRFTTNSQERSTESVIARKHSYKTPSIELPKNGPILLNKPTLFKQVALLNKLTKK